MARPRSPERTLTTVRMDKRRWDTVLRFAARQGLTGTAALDLIVATYLKEEEACSFAKRTLAS